MLALNTDPPEEESTSGYSTNNNNTLTTSYPAGSGHNQWKILVYDATCRSIISPLMSVSDLRSRGVTLHLLISAEREPIEDVSVVYFCEPTKENLSMIARDCAKGLYGGAHLNFVTKLPRGLMEEFAGLVVQSGSLDKVASVHDQYLDYVCLERGLFTLNKRNSYVRYNGSCSEEDIEKAMNEIAYGLFSVVSTLGVVPVIRCPTGGAPEMVARKLNKMISEHPNLNRRGKGTASSQHHRPLLVILDRNADLITPCQHTSTYQALIDDVLKHHANRVQFTIEEKPTEAGGAKHTARRKKVVKKYDLDADTDPFYSSHKFNPFPQAIESNGMELQNVTQREAEVRSKTSNRGVDSNTTTVVDESAAGADLANAVDSLPALLEQKKQLEIHTSILQAVMNEVAKRDIPTFYELESSLATGAYRNDLAKAHSDVLEMVRDVNKGNIQDKIRLISVYCLATTCPSSSIDQVINAMRESYAEHGQNNSSNHNNNNHNNTERMKEIDIGTKTISYLKRLRSMQMIPTVGESAFQDKAPSSGNAAGGGTDMLSSFMARAQTQASGLLAKATERVGTMLGKIHKHQATRVVESLCEQRPNSEDESYLYLDPKVKGDVDVGALRGMRTPVREVIAFMVGGGCYAEYQNLQMVANERRTITYGCTELVDANVFLGQLSQLA